MKILAQTSIPSLKPSKRLWKNPETKNLPFVGLENNGLAGGVFQSTLRAAALLSAAFVAIQSGSRLRLPSFTAPRHRTK